MLYLPGTASLVQDIDKRVMVVLRDGRYVFHIVHTAQSVLFIVIFCESDNLSEKNIDKCCTTVYHKPTYNHKIVQTHKPSIHAYDRYFAHQFTNAQTYKHTNNILQNSATSAHCRTLIGYLRSLDQFGNLLLTQTIERIHVRDKYGDIDRGVFLIRGENIVLCGETDFRNAQFKNLIRVSQEEILNIQVHRTVTLKITSIF